MQVNRLAWLRLEAGGRGEAALRGLPPKMSAVAQARGVDYVGHLRMGEGRPCSCC